MCWKGLPDPRHCLWLHMSGCWVPRYWGKGPPHLECQCGQALSRHLWDTQTQHWAQLKAQLGKSAHGSLKSSSLWSEHPPQDARAGHPSVHKKHTTQLQPSSRSSLAASYWATEGPRDLAAGRARTNPKKHPSCWERRRPGCFGGAGSSAVSASAAGSSRSRKTGARPGKTTSGTWGRGSKGGTVPSPSVGSTDRWPHVFKLTYSLTSFANSR